MANHGHDDSRELTGVAMRCDVETLRCDPRGFSLTELMITLALFGLVAAAVVGTWSKAQEAYFAGSESAEVQQNLRAAMDFMVREIRSTGRDATLCTFDYATTVSADCDGTKVTRCAALLAGTGTPAWEADNGLGGSGCAGLHAIPFGEATVETLRIRSDRNQNGRIGGRANAVVAPASAADRGEEDVLYALSTVGCPPGVPRCITRDDGTGPVSLVAVAIDGLAFAYYPRPNFGPCAGVAGPCGPAFSLPFTNQAQADGIGRIRIAMQGQRQIAGQTVRRTLVTEVTLRNRS
jgi:prepilin-type N-terminal cleavage/methylation domain-containing protein